MANQLTDAQKRAKNNYYKKAVKKITIEFYYKTDSDILDFLGGLENKQGFIKESLRKNMPQNCQEKK